MTTSPGARVAASARSLLVGMIAAMLAFPALAAAQGSSPTRDQYKDIPACLDCGDPDGGLGGNVGPLPFTGFDVIAMVGGGPGGHRHRPRAPARRRPRIPVIPGD